MAPPSGGGAAAPVKLHVCVCEVCVCVAACECACECGRKRRGKQGSRGCSTSAGVCVCVWGGRVGACVCAVCDNFCQMETRLHNAAVKQRNDIVSKGMKQPAQSRSFASWNCVHEVWSRATGVPRIQRSAPGLLTQPGEGQSCDLRWCAL